jgi:glutamate-5-semialdehyde dehydrogenase
VNHVADLMQGIGRAARSAARVLAFASTDEKNRALLAAAAALRSCASKILAANEGDIREVGSALSGALLDRLQLNEARVEAMARGLEEVAAARDPIGVPLAEWSRPNGMLIQRVCVPLGVIGIIYESRPNVTADAGALCLKSGNAVILRGGSESARSSAAIHACLQEGLGAAGLPAACIDVIVPRGGKSLISRVQKEARVPVIGHLEGVCHVFVDRGAQLEMAKRIVVNAKMRRTGVCGAAETLLVDRGCAGTHLAPLVKTLLEAGCEVRGDEATASVDVRVKAASEQDWYCEYLDAIIAVRVVDDIAAAIAHVARYGSQHTECIVTDDLTAAERFLREVDSAIVLHNASTQFADGAEFGMGAEIGISTDKFHARGPVGVEQLTSYKYVVRGSGQTRD